MKITITSDNPKKKKSGRTAKLAVWAATVATLCPATSYTLASLGFDPVTEVTIAVFAGCIGFLGIYAGKSAYEKHDRNVNRVDENGVPFEYTYGQNHDTEFTETEE